LKENHFRRVSTDRKAIKQLPEIVMTYKIQIRKTMKKNFIISMIVALGMTGFAGVSFAADAAAPAAKPAAAAPAAEPKKAEAPKAEAKKKVVKKKASKKAVAKKAEVAK
jgi:hypothetical protein